MQDLLSGGKTLYERRFGVPFKGPVILFGAMVEYHAMAETKLGPTDSGPHLARPNEAQINPDTPKTPLLSVLCVVWCV